jgi:hypothetical protein
VLNQVAGSSLPTMLPPLLYACASLSRRAFALIDACRCCLTFSQAAFSLHRALISWSLPPPAGLCRLSAAKCGTMLLLLLSLSLHDSDVRRDTPDV